ncbi:MAG: cell division protein ZapA [Clostridiales bacterium]|nr:cell division protein ZapA [Clostridiales bacterium]
MEYNKVRVNVCGKEFALQTEESAGYMKELAKILDSKINDFMDQNPGVDLTSSAILIGLSVLDDSFKTNSDIDNIRAQIASYAAETAQAMDKIDELEEKIELLNREKENLQRDLELHALRDQIQ